MSETRLTWPERLVLRDTKVFADEGQRIFSTATGYGYEKREYIRADAVDDLIAALREAKAFHDRDSGCNGFTADYECLRLQIDNALSRTKEG